MPTATDTTVVNSAYDTSGNGGRKLVRLSNGWLVAILYDGTNTTHRVRKSTDNGATWTQVCTIKNGTTMTIPLSMVNKGNRVYIFGTLNNANTFGAWTFDVTTQTDVDIMSTFTQLDIGQTTHGASSLAINDAGTELHAVWASKNATYPNSYNIRYAKGTINGDGSVTWGTAVQGSALNTTGVDLYDPAAFYAGGVLRVIAHYKTTASHYIRQYSAAGGVLGLDSTLVDSGNINYVQTLPSAIYVPQSVNGLANGRIWAAWQGGDAYVPSGYRLFVSYSDNYGTTWTTAVVSDSTSRNYYSPSLTASKTNEVYVLYHSSMSELLYAKNTNGTWGTPVVVKTIINPYVSALYDPTVKFTYPLFIYRDTAKVGFYGTWTTTTISVTPGSLGLKTNGTNLLTYAITTDDTMSTITESVNGTVVGTKNATSGQSLIAGLTQAQWDLIKYGRYKDATGGLNTLTVTMGTNTWTYTFDKRPASDADIITHMQALKDGADTFIPSVKAKLIAKTNGNVNDSFENIINGMQMKKYRNGMTSTNANGDLVVTGLPFTPSKITLTFGGGETILFDSIVSNAKGVQWVPATAKYLDKTVTLTAGGFTILAIVAGAGLGSTLVSSPVTWTAIE